MHEEASFALWCEAMAVLLDLPIEEGDHSEIIANLRVLARQMQLVGDFPLGDQAEPAVIFRA